MFVSAKGSQKPHFIVLDCTCLASNPVYFMYWTHSQNNVTLKGYVKFRANGRNVVGCYTLRPFAHSVACCWELLDKSLKPVKLSATCKLTDAKTPNNVASLCSGF